MKNNEQSIFKNFSRVGFLSSSLIFLLCAAVLAQELQKPMDYQAERDYVGWVMSEKYDGIRAVWDGAQLKTRQGKTIYAPDWFLKKLPPFAIDGELWTKRQDLENIQSIVMEHTPSKRWGEIKYYIFEIPNAKGHLETRYNTLKTWLGNDKNTPLRLVQQIKITSKNHLNTFYQQLIKQGAEGIIVKNPDLNYFSGRTPQSVKRKKVADMEGVVIAINKGKGKFENMMGSLEIQLENGLQFKLGTGFSDSQRKNPPKIGSQVKFKYYGFTKKGIPRHASFLLIRKD